jgi:hypothetical protein
MEEVVWWVLLCIAWLVACWLAFVYVSVPVTLVAVAAGLSVGAGMAAWGYLRVYLGAEDERVLIEPASTVPRGSSAPYPYWDNGWPGYLTGQLERDIRAAWGWPGRQIRTMWENARDLARPRGRELAAAWPVLPPVVGFLVAVTAGAYAAWLAFAAAGEAAAVIPRLVRWAAIAVLRAVDASVRWWHGAAATCPRCRGVTRLPAYRCLTRHQDGIHRDVRPGRLGVWWRRCVCYERLPSTVLRAAPTLTPVCPACEGLLHERGGAAPDARIAVSGGPASGKTQLVMSAMAKMTDGATAPAAWEPADEYSTTWLDDTRESMARRPPRGPEPTEQPALMTLRGGAFPWKRYLHVVDVGGRHFMTADQDPELRHLGTTRRHLLVFDPTTIPSVRDKIDPALLANGHADDEASRVAGTETSSAAAELPYHRLVAELNRLGLRTRRCSLAVAITKADVLAKQGLGPGADPAKTLSHRLRAWLCESGLRNLVETAEGDFGQVRYFLVGLGMKATDPVAPFTWLLSRHRRGAGIR